MCLMGVVSVWTVGVLLVGAATLLMAVAAIARVHGKQWAYVATVVILFVVIWIAANAILTKVH